MLGFLDPSPTLTPRETRRSQRLMMWGTVMGGAMFSLGSGGFMAAYALALGANNLQVGILAALPPVSQVVQLPAILAVERFRKRKAIGLPAWFLGQLVWLPIAAVPFVLDTPGTLAISAVIVLLALRGLFNPVWVTAQNSWMRDLIPQELLGRFFSRRLGTMTATIVIVGLAGSFFVSWWQSFAPPDQAIYAYSFLLLAGWLTFGVIGPALVGFSKEPLMPAAPESDRSAWSIILEPLRDADFRRLFQFLFFWNFAMNLAVPFFAVYMLTRLGFSLPVVIGFTMLSQVTNVLFIRVWGAMADRFGSKTVLSLSASLFLLVVIGWVFTTNPERHLLTIPLLTVLHVFAGVATAGIQLTVQTIALKTAPEGSATPYIGIAGIGTGLGAGIGPIVGGALADFFDNHLFRIDLSWTSADGVLELPALTLTGIDFLFVVSFCLGVVTLNLLAQLREEGAADREVAMRELIGGMDPVLRAVSSVPGAGFVTAASYGYVKRVPGADVALGVMAYELASSTQAAVASAGRGRRLAADAESMVGNALFSVMGRLQDAGVHSVALAQHATRGAMHVGDELVDQLEGVVQSSITGSLRALDLVAVDPLDSLYGAGYGALQGALESEHDPVRVSRAAIAAARGMASELGVTEDEAARAVADGILTAASNTDAETLDSVREALPQQTPNPESPDSH
ncbi:MAG: MFS transporter [Chloroflexota bacterium]|nr:MFS transporter [Chloroflexota bacterium]MDE2685818.1 MFS transporter [Chloroflexota bacterium]